MNSENQNNYKLNFDDNLNKMNYENIINILNELKTKFYVIDINSLKIIAHNNPNLNENNYKCFELLGLSNQKFTKCEECVIDEIIKTKNTVTREFETLIDGEKKFQKIISNPIFDKEGNFDKILCEVYDVTTTKKYLDELKESEAKYHSIISQTADCFYLMDLETNKVLEANQALLNLLEYSETEIKNITVFDFIIDPKNNILNIIERLKLLDRIYLPHRQYKTKSGKIIDLEVNATIIQYRGKPVLSAISRDITNRILTEKALFEAQKKLKIANEFKSSIISNISHEMRTPLTTILGFTKILYEEIPNNEYRTMIKMIQTSGKRLEKTLTSLLTLSELESKDYQLNLQTIRLVDIINTASILFEELLDKKHIYLLESINDYHICIKTDEFLIYQILFHLLDNAIKYTEKGYIKVEADSFKQENNLFAVIRIKDTGPGIPDEQFDLIFNAFQKGDAGLTHNLEGIGIGLTLVKKMVEILNGNISVESKKNIGTVFNIIFPGFTEDN